MRAYTTRAGGRATPGQPTAVHFLLFSRAKRGDRGVIELLLEAIVVVAVVVLAQLGPLPVAGVIGA